MKKKYIDKLFLLFLISLVFSGCTLLISTKTDPTNTSDYNTKTAIVTKSSDSTPYITTEPAMMVTTMSIVDMEQTQIGTNTTNEQCQLPCYLGIIPGKTSWVTASELLSTRGKILGPVGEGNVEHYSVIFSEFSSDLNKKTAGFYVRDGVVIAITTSSDSIRKNFDNSLSGFLNEFGIPEEIWISPIVDSNDDQPYYYLVLWYPTKGVYVDINANATKQGEYLLLCPQEIYNRVTHAPWVVLWNPEEQVNFKQFGKSLLGDDLGRITDEYKLIDEISTDQMTNDQFFNTYKSKNSEACFSVIPIRK